MNDAENQTPISDAQRWRLVKEFHPLLRLEHWDGHVWGPLYGEAADKIVDELILRGDGRRQWWKAKP